MEKLLELASDERFDLVVLDTPPTRHALDFLEAPDRLLGFLDTSVLRFFLQPVLRGRPADPEGRDAHGRACSLKLADRFLGLQFLQDLVRVLPGVRGDVRRLQGARAARGARAAARAEHRLRAGGGPSRCRPRGGALLPRAAASRRSMPLRGLRREPGAPRPGARARRTARRRRRGSHPGSPRGSRRRCASSRCSRASSGRRSRGSRSTRARSRCCVPELEQDVHDLRGLLAFAALVFPRGREEARAAGVSR